MPEELYPPPPALPPPPPPPGVALPDVGEGPRADDVVVRLLEEAAAAVVEEVEEVVVPLPAEAALDLGVRCVVTPAGFVLRRTFFVLGNLLSFLYFIRRFWNQILICLSDRQSACAISILLRRVR